jgi:hypothetical protein
MNVQLEGRAEIALRSLDQPEQEKVQAALQVLEKTDLGELMGSQRPRAMKVAPQETLHSFRVNKTLRLILSASPSQWVVEDIMQRDRLARLLPASEL